MISPWTIYWITRLDAIRGLSNTVFIIGAILLCVLMCITPIIIDVWGEKDKRKIILRAIRIGIGSVCVGVACLTFTPSTKEAAAIYLIPKIVNNEQVQQVPENALRLLNIKLEEWIQDSLAKPAKPAE